MAVWPTITFRPPGGAGGKDDVGGMVWFDSASGVIPAASGCW